MWMYRRHRRDARGAIIGGLMLIAIGVLFLGLKFHWWPDHEWWQWWVFFVAGIGVLQILTSGFPFDPWSPRRVGGGVTTLLLGAWCWGVQTHWHGLDWMNSWPLTLIAVGAGMVVRALAGLVVREPKEDGHVGSL